MVTDMNYANIGVGMTDRLTRIIPRCNEFKPNESITRKQNHPKTGMNRDVNS